MWFTLIASKSPGSAGTNAVGISSTSTWTETETETAVAMQWGLREVGMAANKGTVSWMAEAPHKMHVVLYLAMIILLRNMKYHNICIYTHNDLG